MQTVKGSYHNLAALSEGGPPVTAAASPRHNSRLSHESGDSSSKQQRLVIVSNHLPLRVKKGEKGWEFEWDEDSLYAQAKEGIIDGTEFDVLYVGCLPVEIQTDEQEEVSAELKRLYNCSPVFIDTDVREKYYKGFCKQQLWPLFHYILPISPISLGRFDSDLWQAYVKANKSFADKLVEECSTDTDFVWIHDYHLLVLPSLLRKRFNRIRCGLFLHSPFPSSEIFRTFPKREELLRSLLNADLIGFHTFDYARHFLSCCSRMLGMEHETSRGSISLEYCGRTCPMHALCWEMVSKKVHCVNPQRYIDGFGWDEYKWRRGELLAQYEGMTVLVGVDDMDVFKGIELKLMALERLLEQQPEYRGNTLIRILIILTNTYTPLRCVQITNPPRSTGRDIGELHKFVTNLVDSINLRFGKPEMGYLPVHYLERHVPLHERMAFYSIADCAVVTATRDGMNLVPYEYVLCRHGLDEDTTSKRDSMLVVSEFVGCSPSLSGAIRVNPWSVESVADGIHAARVTKNHTTMKCYGLGLGLDTFRMVALDANFRKLEENTVTSCYQSCKCRVFFLDYDGTLTSQNSRIDLTPSPEVLSVLQALTSDARNLVCLFSGRLMEELSVWFASVPNLGLVAENGSFFRPASAAKGVDGGGSSMMEGWESLVHHTDLSWQNTALPILQSYQESTDGSSIERKESALVWSYRDADPDFGSWQAKELLDHLEDVMSNKPIQIVRGNSCVEIKPQGVSKGQAVERILKLACGQEVSVSRPVTTKNTPSHPSVSKAAEVPPPGEKPGMILCIGQKPSRAPFYLNESSEVLQLLAKLVNLQLGPLPSV
eukprot:gene15885-22013_t